MNVLLGVALSIGLGFTPLSLESEVRSQHHSLTLDLGSKQTYGPSYDLTYQLRTPVGAELGAWGTRDWHKQSLSICAWKHLGTSASLGAGFTVWESHPTKAVFVQTVFHFTRLDVNARIKHFDQGRGGRVGVSVSVLMRLPW